MSAVLDTHAAIWYLLDSPMLPRRIVSFLEDAASRGEPSYISAITLVEVVYLAERNRVESGLHQQFLNELESDNPVFSVVPVDASIAELLPRVSRELVPDMPDRIIAATGLRLNLPLVTRDRKLQASSIPTMW
jgi:PIN domain nuclease of toxin-antitoxin system